MILSHITELSFSPPPPPPSNLLLVLWSKSKVRTMDSWITVVLKISFHFCCSVTLWCVLTFMRDWSNACKILSWNLGSLCRVQAQVHNNILYSIPGEFCIRVVCSSLLSWLVLHSSIPAIQASTPWEFPWQTRPPKPKDGIRTVLLGETSIPGGNYSRASRTLTRVERFFAFWFWKCCLMFN